MMTVHVRMFFFWILLVFGVGLNLRYVFFFFMGNLDLRTGQ